MENKMVNLNALTLPFSGLNVIEASAGTGKTFTLAALYVRIVIGHMPESTQLQKGLLPSQILVMTFTDAATAELRARIRERLSKAAQFFRQIQLASHVIASEDAFLLSLKNSLDSTEYEIAADRLEMAAQWMDDAAIYTIHSWSSRMLKEHAFDSGALFQQSHAQDSEKMMLLATQDYWRRFLYPLDSEQARQIITIISEPEDLLKKVKSYWSAVDKNPSKQFDQGESPEKISRQLNEWKRKLQCCVSNIQKNLTADLQEFLLANAQHKWLQGFSAKQMESRLREVNTWLAGKNPKITGKMLGYFANLENVAELSRYQDLWLVFQKCADLLEQKPNVKEALLEHAALHIHHAYEAEKKRRAQFDFNDLLKELYKALQNPDARLAKAIAQQYPIALVDEFQDTDPWQYGSLQKIYQAVSEPQEVLEFRSDQQVSAKGLIMIGDPKQAIYSFRGADINTYLLARNHASAVYTLGYNYRSNEALVKAVNFIFSTANQPFAEIQFNEVEAIHKDELSFQLNNKAKSALTVWHLQHQNKVPNKRKLATDLAEISASHMTDLLNNNKVKSGEIAVLVRSAYEASVIRAALAKRAIRSVYLSEKDSVFESTQAQDLWRVLRAVSNPQNLAWVKAALATKLWGLSWTQLEFYIQNEKAWDAILEQFMSWQERWKKQGVLAMIYAWLHEQKISQKLLTQNDSSGIGNERTLSNVLHLAELLQNASMHLQSQSALVRYLENQLQDPKASGEAALLRLESDEKLVKVITMHKSKGLEYPYVYLPFVSFSRAPEANATDEEIKAELFENIRLLYVAFTRAKKGLMMTLTEVNKEFSATGKNNPFKMSAASYLLGRQAAGDLSVQLAKWQESEFISVQAPPAITNIIYQDQTEAVISKPALINQRTHEARWWTASFSAISKGVALYNDANLMHDPLKLERLEESQSENASLAEEFLTHSTLEAVQGSSTDSTSETTNTYNSIKGGADFGTLLHDLLEWQAHQDWILFKTPEWVLQIEKELLSPDNPDLNGFDWLDEYLEWLHYLEKKLGSSASLLLPTINQWLRQVLHASFNVGTASPLQLGALKRRQVWPEMAFTLPIKKLNAQKIDDWVLAYIHTKQVRPDLKHLPLEGMMTGFMDMVLLHEDQYFILDYKSNKLKDYSLFSLTEAVLHHRYEVQYTLYILALHRLLKARLKDYSYELDVGGAIYLFVRGINEPSQGLYFNKPPFELINALDILFRDPSVALPNPLSMNPLRAKMAQASLGI